MLHLCLEVYQVRQAQVHFPSQPELQTQHEEAKALHGACMQHIQVFQQSNPKQEVSDQPLKISLLEQAAKSRCQQTGKTLVFFFPTLYLAVNFNQQFQIHDKLLK